MKSVFIRNTYLAEYSLDLHNTGLYLHYLYNINRKQGSLYFISKFELDLDTELNIDDITHFDQFNKNVRVKNKVYKNNCIEYTLEDDIIDTEETLQCKLLCEEKLNDMDKEYFIQEEFIKNRREELEDEYNNKSWLYKLKHDFFDFIYKEHHDDLIIFNNNRPIYLFYK